ncbi:EpsG family protein [Nocardioides sp. HDW12B]|uniref:EpsG family protein n=1 Tax=Nocardioides sp. HDW12B TaxID=2714939 RepID=UPI00140860C0|nr:EpsG family protein [Nocardioides sp. HDW12B]QIK64960.1 EpsG family protein [Nocardioides sp. HDW12B]
MTVYYLATFFAVGFALLAQRPTRFPTAPTRGDLPPKEPRPNLTLAAAVFLLLAGISALRWRVGTDYVTYELLYERYSVTPFDELSWDGEPGIRVLAKLGRQLQDDSATMFAFAAVVTVGLTVLTLWRRSPMFAFSVALYILTSAWQNSFNGVRQFIACAILFSGHHLIVERKLGKFVGLVFAAALFHISALIAIAAYALPRRRLRPLGVFLLLLATIVATNLYDTFGLIADEIKQDDVSAGSYFTETVDPLRIAVALAPIVLYWLFTDADRLSPYDHLYINLAHVNAAIFIAASGSAYLARFAIYTSIFLTLAYPAIVRVKDRDLQKPLTVVILIFYATFWYIETSEVAALSNFRWIFDR